MQRKRLLAPRHVWLLIAFAFTVMADPISSVAYAIEAALRALQGNLGLLLPTMVLVIAVIALVTINYHQLVARFPEGGGAAAAAGAALGEAWAFLPIGALVVDFVLTIAISVAASASAIIAYFPALAPVRLLLALGLLLVVGGLTWFGHLGRTLFAIMTLAFVGVGAALLVSGWLTATATPVSGQPQPTGSGGSLADVIAVSLAFPVAMALAVALGIGIPPANSTQIADVARAVGSPSLFALFQLTTTLLLLSAASSSFQAGPGLLKALARQVHAGGQAQGILPAWMGRINRHYTPYWGVALYTGIAALVLVAVGAQDQELVLFYAVAVFVSFLVGLLAMAHFSFVEHKHLSLSVNVLGAVTVGFTLLMNLLRGWPLLSLGAAAGIAVALYLL